VACHYTYDHYSILLVVWVCVVDIMYLCPCFSDVIYWHWRHYLC